MDFIGDITTLMMNPQRPSRNGMGIPFSRVGYKRTRSGGQTIKFDDMV